MFAVSIDTSFDADMFTVALPFTASMRFGLSRASKFCPSVVLVRASEVLIIDLVCAYLDGFLVVSFPGLRSRLRGAGHSTLRGTSTAESVRWGFVLRHPPHILGDGGAFVLCLAARGVSVKVAVFGAVRRRYVTSIIAPWVARPYR